MRPGLRQARILDRLKVCGQASVEDLASRFSTSHETIRRDLNVLAETGAVQKVYGGAKLPHLQHEGPFRQRLSENAGAKRSIALKVVELISPGDTIFIDTGSTTVICAEELKRVSGLTVITNSSRIAAVMSGEGKNATVFLLGGRFDADNRETLGPSTISGIATFRADHAIVGVGAVDAGGAMNFSFDEAQVARAMIDNSSHAVVLADATKHSKPAAFRVCALERIGTFVSDLMPGKALHNALSAASVAIC